VKSNKENEMASKREQKLDNRHNKTGSKRGKGTRAKRAAQHGTARNKYDGMGGGDKENDEAKGDDFNIDLVRDGGGYWIYGKVRFVDFEFTDNGYAKYELKNLYPQVRADSDFCRIKKKERYHLVSGGLERHYVYVESGGIVGAVMGSGERVSERSRLDDLIPGIFEYVSGRDKI